MFDTEKFTRDWLSPTQQQAIRYCLKRKDEWIAYDELYSYMQRTRMKRHPDKVERHGKRYQGQPCSIRRTIRVFVQYGFLLADPQKGLKVNQDFIPINQK
jgi:hypothetical protein